MPLVRDYRELRVYRFGFQAAMDIFEQTKRWPAEERYSLTDQIRRSSRSVTANIAEAWRKRLYVPSFVSKLSDANAEAAETQVWLDYAKACGYMLPEHHGRLFDSYHQVSGGLIKMISEAEMWCGPAAVREAPGQYELEELQEPPASKPPER